MYTNSLVWLKKYLHYQQYPWLPATKPAQLLLKSRIQTKFFSKLDKKNKMHRQLVSLLERCLRLLFYIQNISIDSTLGTPQFLSLIPKMHLIWEELSTIEDQQTELKKVASKALVDESCPKELLGFAKGYLKLFEFMLAQDTKMVREGIEQSLSIMNTTALYGIFDNIKGVLKDHLKQYLINHFNEIEMTKGLDVFPDYRSSIEEANALRHLIGRFLNDLKTKENNLRKSSEKCNWLHFMLILSQIHKITASLKENPMFYTFRADDKQLILKNIHSIEHTFEQETVFSHGNQEKVLSLLMEALQYTSDFCHSVELLLARINQRHILKIHDRKLLNKAKKDLKLIWKRIKKDDAYPEDLKKELNPLLHSMIGLRFRKESLGQSAYRCFVLFKQFDHPQLPVLVKYLAAIRDDIKQLDLHLKNE